MITNNFFRCKNQPDKNIVFERLYSFKSEETGKNYMIYTDNKVNSKGNIRVFAGIYDPNDNELNMKPIETEKDWKIVDLEWRKQLFGDENQTDN